MHECMNESEPNFKDTKARGVRNYWRVEIEDLLQRLKHDMTS